MPSLFSIRLVLILLILAPAALAQVRWFQGRVYRPNGQPLELSIRVEIRGPRASNQTVDTNSSGQFHFKVDVIGEFTIVVDAGEEFEVATESILIDEKLLTANSLSDGNSSWVNIYLKPKSHSVVYQTTTVDAKLAKVPKKALDHYGKGLKLAAATKFAEAVTELQKAIQAYAGFYQAQTELGKVFMKLSRFEEAAAAFRSALATEPNIYEARFHLGMALLNQKKFEEALPEYNTSAELDKTAVSPHYYAGIIKYESGETDSSIASFEKARTLNGDKPFPMLHKYLASLYLKKSQWALAAAELEIYLAQSPDATDAESIRTTLAAARARIK
jgi:tetratricopeptide (TPR) repeat protein